MKTPQKNQSERKWIALIILLLTVEIIWLLIDLQWINLPVFFRKTSYSGATEAGHVIKAKNELKRRGMNSLIWEATKENEALFYHDSVLTLSESTAKLYLKDQTELQLSENTLVTLEEPDDKSKSEIRLRFSKGDFRARNPTTKTSIQGDEWTVNLEKGSEVALRKDKDSYEFEIVSGQATLQTAGKTENLNNSSIIKLGADQQIKKIQKSQNLRWSDKKPLRVYVFNDSASVSLQWVGSAKNLSINKVGEAEENQLINPEQKSVKVDLKLGSYRIRLANENGLSMARTVEVWKAPRIFLKKPLPRDRLKTGVSHEFVWTDVDGIKDYQIKLSGNKSAEQTENSTKNFKSLIFENEQDLVWKVEGRDDEGYLIPSFYENKIYIREEPLEAPKLKAPNILTPEESSYKGSFFYWWKLLIAEAQAAKANQEIVFEWESVQGADYYIIEISSDPDFRYPEVIENVNKTRYVWKKYDNKKKYYWRVASANSRGRMGLFSEASELKPQFKTKSAESTSVPFVEKPAARAAEIITAEPVRPVEIIKPQFVPSGWGIAWAPSYKVIKHSGDENSKIQLSGVVPLSVLLEYKTPLIGEKYFYHARLFASSQLWKPNPVSEFPFQENLNIPEIQFDVMRGETASVSRIGLTFHQSFIPARKTDESITSKLQSVLGIRYAYGNYGISGGTSGNIHEVNVDLNYKKYLSENVNATRYYYGVAVNILYQFNQYGGGSQTGLILLFGLDQF